MAGLIQRLFGGKPSPAVDMDPAPGIGGYTLGTGPAGETGFPGSTAQTRTYPRPPNSPRAAKIRADTDTGWDGGLTAIPQVRQASYRGDVPNAARRGPRATPPVATPQPVASATGQGTPGTQYGGPMMTTGLDNNTAGGHPLSEAQFAGGHSERDTTTPWPQANIVIGGGTPGAQNVRNTVALKYQNPPGESHTYQSAPRPDQAPVNPGGQATDGNVQPGRVTQEVTVPNRAVIPAGDGNWSWSVLREMPYGGRGDGARGADLNGQRRYATGQEDQFWNAGQGDFGIARQRGGKRPVAFTQPAPWTANVYDTTESVGTATDPNQNPGQQPNAVYVSPTGQRASNSTGRTG